MTSTLDAIEHHYFLQSYNDESIPTRLARIERLVSGQTDTGGESERQHRSAKHE